MGVSGVLRSPIVSRVNYMIIKGLDQSSTLHPLPWEFVSFADVTCRASKYQIVHTICRNSTASDPAQRISVLNMKDMLAFNLLEFSMSACRVIAAVSLPFQLLCDLSRGMSTSNASFAGSIGTISRLKTCLVRMVVTFPSVRYSLFVLLTVTLSPPRDNFFVDLIVDFVVLLMLFFVLIIPCLLANKASPPDSISHAILFTSFMLTFLALIIKSDFLHFARIKELFSQWVNVFAYRAPLVAFRDIRWPRRPCSALSALGVQSISPGFVVIKKFICRCLGLFTLAALLVTFGYGNTRLLFVFFVGYSYTAFTLSIKPIPLPFVGEKELFGGGKKLFTLCALFLCNCLTYRRRDVFNRLGTQRFKIECALSEVFWYTVHTDETNPFIRHVPKRFWCRWLQHRSGVVGTNHIQLPHHYIINRPLEQCEVAL